VQIPDCCVEIACGAPHSACDARADFYAKRVVHHGAVLFFFAIGIGLGSVNFLRGRDYRISEQDVTWKASQNSVF
jgi:hypothetical protein